METTFDLEITNLSITKSCLESPAVNDEEQCIAVTCSHQGRKHLMSHMIGKEWVDINEFSSQRIILVPYLSRILINTVQLLSKKVFVL